MQTNVNNVMFNILHLDQLGQVNLLHKHDINCIAFVFIDISAVELCMLLFLNKSIYVKNMYLLFSKLGSH